MIKHIQEQERGFALLLSLIVSSVALSIGLSMLHITMKQLTLGTTTKGSEIAFQAAHAGMECLRYTRKKESTKFIDGASSVIFDCLVSTPRSVAKETLGSSNVYKYYASNIDWDTGTTEGLLCTDIEIFMLNSSNENGDVTYTFPNGETKTCINGDVCTYGFVRGYNRSCADIAGSIFTVQRELTIEF